MTISQPPFEIQLGLTIRFDGMIKENNINSVIQRENVRGTSENRQLHLVDEHCDFPVQLHIVIFNSSGGAISHAVATGS